MIENESDEERFDDLVADYLDALSEGKPLDEAALLAANPEFADELQKFFADHRRMGGLLENGAEDTHAPTGKTRAGADAPTLINTNSNANDYALDSYDVDPDKCIADYLLLEKIAEGGMGVVFKAKQLSLNRIVAFKMIRAGEFADVEEVRRFRVEAEAAARLTHPGIVPIYQIGEDKGQHFFSMALIDGPSLADLIRDEPMKPRRAAKYVSQVARAVHYAHEQGIIHRDIKPANVLVDTDDVPKVTDFGLAKQITSDHELTMSGQILGTASYMPPEQAAGHEITPLADVYSIGALLYALLTKRPPFTGANPVDILLDVLSKDPASPSSLNISLSRDLETICMRCLDKDPQRRYDSAAAVAEDLDRYLEGTPILARPVGRIEKCLRWCKRRPAVATAIALSIMLCFAAFAYYSKKGETRYFGGNTGQAAKQHSDQLQKQAQALYSQQPPIANSDRERLMVQAGMAMLSYDRSAKVGSESEQQYLRVAEAIQAARNVDPTDPELKSAFADCLLQRARFRFTDTRRTGADTTSVGTVSDADAANVAKWLGQAASLLSELCEQFPDNDLLAARLAAVQAAMENVPGSFAERMEHLLQAGETSRVWDTARGVIRFSVAPPLGFESDAEELDRLTELKAAGEAEFSSRDSLQLADALCVDKQVLNAIREFRTLLANGSLSAEELQLVFTDLTILADDEPVAVELALEDKWPLDAEAFHRAMLGIRLAR